MAITSSVTLSDPTGALGTQRDAFIVDANAAAHDWLKWFVGTASIEIQINITSLPSHPTANGGWNTSTYVGVDGSRLVYQSGVESEILTGTDPNGGTADAFMNVDVGWLGISWINPAPGTGTTPANRIDAMSWLRHEIGHALGIGGWIDDTTGTRNASVESPWDQLVGVRPSDGAAVFMGPNAVATYGGPVPLTMLKNGEAYYHFGNSTSEPLYNDLMQGVSTQWGKAYLVSALDLAVMKDLGYNVYHGVYEGTPAVEGHAFRAYSGSVTFGYGSLSGPEGPDSFSGVPRASFTDGVVNYDVHAPAWEVARLYKGILGRDYDGSGLANWVNAIEHGSLSTNQVANSFVGSPEFSQRYGNLSNKDFVDALYANVLHRTADPTGESNWLSFLSQGMTRGTAAVGFCDSNEFIGTVAAQFPNGVFVQDQGAAQIARLYDAAFQRAPDDGGLGNWTAALHGGMSLSAIAAGFVNSAELAARYGTLDNQHFVDQLYINALGRQADPTGEANWISFLSHGMTRQEVLVGFSESVEHQAKVQPHLDHGFLLA